jgi:hypothetical protein
MALAGCAVLGMGADAAMATPASTNACSSNCTDVWFVNPGSQALVTSHSALNKTNNVVRLTQGSNGAPKQDFTEIDAGTVVGLYCTPWGTAVTGSIFTDNQCHLLDVAGLLPANTFQFAFNANNGGPENRCLGAWNNDAPVSGWKIRLEPCGESADTVIIETETLDGATLTSSQEWLINGASDNYSNPVVATSAGSFPSNLTWTQININGKQGTDTQEACLTAGPFTSGASC